MVRTCCISALFMCLFFSFSACKDDDTGDSLLLVSPEENILLEPGETFAFHATLAANWETTGGTINADGLYTAPDVAGVFEVKVTNPNNAQNIVLRKVVVTPHAPLFKSIREGGYVLYFRHTNATLGADNFNSTLPEWWKSCDQTVARQLSDAGRQEARDLGSAFKNMNCTFGTVIASEFCRCRQTAELMETGATITTSPAMTFTVYGEDGRYERTIALANEQPITDRPILFMAHSFPVNGPGPALQMGDMAVYQQHAGDSVQLVKVITLAELAVLK
ncbi:MAG: histidine phosphatase family protein [Saprospiraceae bacterium]